MNVRYWVELSQTERAELTALLSGGKHAARKLKRAQILLAADAGVNDDEIARSVGVGGSTGSYGSGLGLGLGFDLSGPPPAVADTRMGVIIRDGASAEPLWEGRADFTASANSRYGNAEAAAAKMAAALFAGFPGRSGETVEVR